ncbi:hypothetical protein ACFQV2_33185 [Actinokineospora soli]|uniref:DUF4209 domain-containing protein n=1 Tax=Actinokineospora soli TaxID=1048753 RepID=A0ABW2TXB4_9PSEU
MAERTSDPAAREAIFRRELESYMAEALQFTGFQRQAILQNGIEQARKRQLADVSREFTAELQKIRPSDLPMQRFVLESSIPCEQIEAYLHQFSSGRDWRRGMVAFLQSPCPTGELSELRAASESIASEATFLQLARPVRLTAEALPHWTARNDSDIESHNLSRTASTYAQLQGGMLKMALDRIKERYGTPTVTELANLISQLGCGDESLAFALARSIELHWSGYYDEAAHFIIPRVESAARLILRELDEGIYRIQVAADPGGYPGLYTLLEELEKLGLDESWAYYLRWLFLGPPGLNIRNDVAHGLSTGINSVYSTLVLRGAALLICIAPHDEEHDERLVAKLGVPVPTKFKFPSALPSSRRFWKRTMALALHKASNYLDKIAGRWWT